MLNCLKSDFYRVFKSKSFYICLGVTAGASLLFILILGIAEASLNGKFMFGFGMASNVVAITTAIFVSIFVTSDYSSGMMKNYVSGSISRTKIYFSKYIVCLTIPIIFLLASTLLSGLAGTAAFGYGVAFSGAEFAEIIIKILLGILLLSAFVSLFFFFAVWVRSPGGVIAINISMLMVVDLILLILAFSIPSLRNIPDYWLTQNISDVAFSFLNNPFASGDGITVIFGSGVNLIKDIWLRVFLVGVIYTVIATVPAYALFITKDVR